MRKTVILMSLIASTMSWAGERSVTVCLSPDSRVDYTVQVLAQGFATRVYRAIGMEPTDRPLADFLVPLDAKRNPLVGSTDVGDVSWVVPTVQVHAPTVAIGTPFNTWQVVAQGKSPHAHKAMVQAAKAMAGLGIARAPSGRAGVWAFGRGRTAKFVRRGPDR